MRISNKFTKLVAAALLTFVVASEIDGANLTKCYGCHGTDFSRRAMGKSAVVRDLNSTEIEKRIKGYQEGTYGGSLKGIMKLQVKDANASDIALSIEKLLKEKAKKVEKSEKSK